MSKDNRLLSEIYSRLMIKESPDTFTIKDRDGRVTMDLGWGSTKAVPFFVFNNQYIFAKVFGTAHNALFSKAIINNFFNLPLDYSKGDLIKSGITVDQIKFEPNNEFITDIDKNGCWNNFLGLSGIQKNFLNVEKTKKALESYTLNEYYVKLITDIALDINSLKMRGVYSPCGRAWIAPNEDPDNVYISYWPKVGGGKISQSEKNQTKKALANMISKYPNAFKIRQGYNFIFEDGEEEFDASKPHIEVDPEKRKADMVARNIPYGTSKEGEVAKRAGYDIPARFKAAKTFGDSFRY